MGFDFEHCMLDLETMSTAPNAAVIAIGAVMFNLKPKFGVDPMGPEFYRVIDLKSSMGHGLVVDASTIQWWMRQEDAARNLFVDNPGSPLPAVLADFSSWLSWAAGRTTNIVKVWGNGSDFDNVILKSAYDACGLEVPWKYSNNRCYRTMRAMMFPNATAAPFKGTKHNALDDAKNQAIHLVMSQGEAKP